MRAEKSDGTFDQEGFRQRAAILLFRDTSQSEVLLVTRLGSPDSWSVPGGGIEMHETPMEAAHRELSEETGARGRITGYLGVHEVSPTLAVLEDQLGIYLKVSVFSTGWGCCAKAQHLSGSHFFG